MPKAGVEGFELHYERAGDGEPLLLIQGMTGTHMSWGRPFLSLLEPRFDCISFDHRGIGYSSPVDEPFTIAELAADAAGLLDALGIESAHVLGISMGGMVAQDLALTYPERLRSLTLGCAYCGGPGSQLMDAADFQALVEAMASGDQERIFRATWELNLSPGFRADESRFAEFVAMAESVPVPQETVQLQLQAIVAHDTSARLPGLEVPTLVVHGSADRVLPFVNGAQIAALMPDAHLERLEDVGHMFWWEQPQRSAALIREHSLASA
ncbi:MAG: alpha/beta fold hydrolase [Solirubrobacterales bacterium]